MKFPLSTYHFGAAAERKGLPAIYFLDTFSKTTYILTGSLDVSQTPVDDKLKNAFDSNDWIIEAGDPPMLNDLQFYYLNCNYWERESIINSMNLSWPLMALVLVQNSINATMDSFAAKTHRFLDYNGSLSQIVLEEDCVYWPTTRNYQDTLESHNCMPFYSKPIIGRKRQLMPPLVSFIGYIVQNIWMCLLKRACRLKLFPSFGTMETVGIDIFGPHLKSRSDIQYIIVIVERFT